MAAPTTVRVIQTSDIHLGMSTFAQPGNPESRLQDLDEVLNRFCGAAASAKADLALLPGDLFDTRHPWPSEQAVAIRFLHQLALICPWRMQPGNHDGRRVLAKIGSSTLLPLEQIDWNGRGGVMLSDGYERVELGGGKAVMLVSVPYPHKRALDVALPDEDPEERHRALALALEAGITRLYEQAKAEAFGDEPIIFAGHLTAVGSVAGSERTLRLEDDVSVGAYVFDQFDYAALGHIHRQQQIGEKAFYAGAPEWVDFGEAGQSKGFLVAEVARGETPHVSVIDSHPRPLVTYQNAMGSDTIPAPPDDLPKGAIVRLRLFLSDRSARGAVNAAVQAFYAAGASYVQSEVIVPERAAVAAERAAAAPSEPTEALASYCRAQGLDPARYVSKFAELRASLSGGQ